MADTPVTSDNNTPPPAAGQESLESANIQSEAGNPGTQPDNWKGDPSYYQTGKKAGKLKPSAATKSTEFSGLNFDALKATPSSNEPQAAPEPPDKKALKAEKKMVEAKIAAKFVMRILDTLTGWISKGTYGADFTNDQRKERNKYREELEQDWQDYLCTLDIPMHPAIVAIMGSMLYVAPAFQTPVGAERAQSIKDKIISKIAVGIFSRGK